MVADGGVYAPAGEDTSVGRRSREDAAGVMSVGDEPGTSGECLRDANHKRGGVRKLMRYADNSS